MKPLAIVFLIILMGRASVAREHSLFSVEIPDVALRSAYEDFETLVMPSDGGKVSAVDIRIASRRLYINGLRYRDTVGTSQFSKCHPPLVLIYGEALARLSIEPDDRRHFQVVRQHAKLLGIDIDPKKPAVAVSKPRI